MTVATDLFGQAIPAHRGKRGRPPHQWTAENSQKVLLWFAAGEDVAAVCEGLGISEPTLRKHYFWELEQQRRSLMLLEAKNTGLIVTAAEAGNAAAMALLDKKIERWKLGPLVRRERPAKPPKLGKKELALIGAREAGDGTPLGRLIN